MRARALMLVAPLVLALNGVAGAHPLDLGYLRVESRPDHVAVVLELDVSTAALAIGVAPEDLAPATVAARAPALAAATIARAPINAGGVPCTWTGASARRAGQTVTIADEARCEAAGPRHWTLSMVEAPATPSTFQLMVRETVDGAERLTMIDRGSPELSLGGAAADIGIGAFVWSGIEHIGVAPSEWQNADGGLQLPDGIDHILFLLALMLAGGTLAQLLGIASGFTLGHSITLALATLDVVRPPAGLIEPLIAITIALSAVEALTGRFRRQRWMIATGFGLIHGFGFAGALTALDLPAGDMLVALFGYNLGVELGQLALVLLLAPAILLVHRRPRAARHVVRAMACVILVLAVHWFIQRTFA